MRLGLGRKKYRPNDLASFGLIGIGALIMLFALPITIYVAAFGGLVAYIGHTMKGR